MSDKLASSTRPARDLQPVHVHVIQSRSPKPDRRFESVPTAPIPDSVVLVGCSVGANVVLHSH